jgi:hypothetical protein
MNTLQLLAFVALMSATAMPSIAQEQGRSHPPSTSSGSYGPGFSGPGLTGPGSSGPGYYGPGSYGPGVGASPSPPTPFSYFSSGGAAAGTPAVLSVIPLPYGSRSASRFRPGQRSIGKVAQDVAIGDARICRGLEELCHFDIVRLVRAPLSARETGGECLFFGTRRLFSLAVRP